MSKSISLKFIKTPNLPLNNDDIKIVSKEIISGDMNVFLSVRKASYENNGCSYELFPPDYSQVLLLAAAKQAKALHHKHSRVNCKVVNEDQSLNTYASKNNQLLFQKLNNFCLGKIFI